VISKQQRRGCKEEKRLASAGYFARASGANR
jgi:hypothetical protein